MLAPTAALAGPAPKIAKDAAKLSKGTVGDLRERIRAKPGAKLAVNVLNMFGTRVAETVHRREVSLGHIDKRLKGVVAMAAEPVLVGASGARAAVLGALPDPTNTVDEVTTFVESLLQNGQLLLGSTRARSAVKAAQTPVAPTHTIRTKGGKKVLTRLRFVCG
jgi:hypothetical protein